MTTVNPLTNLKDIHLPPAISWWPPAPGWWILAVLFILISVFIVCWLLRSYQRRRPRIEALQLLKVLKSQYKNSHSALSTLRALSQLLRRTALSLYKHEEVASMQGLEWLQFLDKTGQTTEFTRGVGNIFGEDLFRSEPDFDLEVLFPLVGKWVKKCPYQS